MANTTMRRTPADTIETLKTERRWCVRDESKTPFFGAGKFDYAKVDDPSTWRTYDEMVSLSQNPRYAGTGFFVSPRENNPGLSLCAIDVDGDKKTGEPNPEADTILAMFRGAYIERSPSKIGYHIICNVQDERMPSREQFEDTYYMKPPKTGLEVYIAGRTKRYMTFTGDRLNDATDEIVDMTDQVWAFLKRYMMRDAGKRAERIRNAGRNRAAVDEPEDTEESEQTPMTDEEIHDRLAVIRRSRQGDKFVKLFDKGDVAGYSSGSEADMALVFMLCEWLGPNPNAIDRAFRKSKLCDDKWLMRGDYRRRTIRYAIDHCEVYYKSPESSVTTPSWMSSLLNHIVGTGSIATENDQTADGTVIKPEDILQKINDIGYGISGRDQITVLPLMCGTGKSTAIRMKMRQLIEENNGDGMIVITDNLDRMRDYLLLRDESEENKEMKQFFEQYRNQITVMTHETLADDKMHEPFTPILIMSTQRWISLSRDEIEGYLSYMNGNRSLILVDEQPLFKREIAVNSDALSLIASKIRTNMPRNPESMQDRDFLLDAWDKVIKFVLDETMESLIGHRAENGMHYLYAAPQRNLNAAMSSVYRRPESAQLPNMSLDEFLDKVSLLMKQYKADLNVNKADGVFYDTCSVADAAIQCLKRGALLHYRWIDDKAYGAYSVLMDYHDRYANLDAKVIILDGTANMSMGYQLYDDLDVRNGDNFQRKLDKLFIHLIDAQTGKTKMQTDSCFKG